MFGIHLHIGSNFFNYGDDVIEFQKEEEDVFEVIKWELVRIFVIFYFGFLLRFSGVFNLGCFFSDPKMLLYAW